MDISQKSGVDYAEDNAFTAGEDSIRVYDMPSAPLAGLLFHNHYEAIKRLAPQGFPFHAAVHLISQVSEEPPLYTEVHMHKCPEINIILSSKDDLTYRFTSGKEEIIVKAPACVWIPAGVPHAANVMAGAGYLVVLVLSEGYEAYGPGRDGNEAG